MTSHRTVEGKGSGVHPAEEIRYLLLAAQREGNRYFTESLRPLGLTASQAEVLRVLQEHQPITLRDLGRLLVCEYGSPSRLVSGMARAGLVASAPSAEDGRAVTLSLTPLGAERAAQVVTIEAELDQQIMRLIQDIPIQPVMDLFWRYIEGRPAGQALARRTGRAVAPGQTTPR
ncbi:MAG TPA: winged helix DNA-binding protein [Ktedonobacterales bacterium]|nr:winged helix DNA-binding protein [Ktedonobacterales bacterium]